MLSSAPTTPPAQVHALYHNDSTMDDLAILEHITSSRVPKFRRREAPFDPLIFAAAVCSGPHVTRHHFHHGFFPTDDVYDSRQELGLYSSCDWTGDTASAEPTAAPRYISQQKPRRERLKELGKIDEDRCVQAVNLLKQQQQEISIPTSVPKKRRPSLLPSHDPQPLHDLLQKLQASPVINNLGLRDISSTAASQKPNLIVQCRARTRVPTPHGEIFLHLYHNNWDSKEHLAIVADPAQLEDFSLPAPPIRSRSLDAVWHEGETDTERIIRGAYVGRLSATELSKPSSASTSKEWSGSLDSIPAPLVRIHSECFTGETIGSMRCDCGEQLDEAMRLISQPQTINRSSGGPPITIPGRGAVIYMRQEGRGIGLLEKIRAYNLQDLGHDTVSANLLLGHGADERGYEIAAAIMKDLGLGEQGGVRLLTNNPEKMEALEKEGIRIVQRVPMVPRTWQHDRLPKLKKHNHKHRWAAKEREDSDADSDSSHTSFIENQLRRGGATLIGGSAARGPELEKYLRTKVTRMRHMIDLPPTAATSTSTSSDTAVSTPSRLAEEEAAYSMQMGLTSQMHSDEEDDEEALQRMSQSVRSLMASTPDLESDRESLGGGRPISPSAA